MMQMKVIQTLLQEETGGKVWQTYMDLLFDKEELLMVRQIF